MTSFRGTLLHFLAISLVHESLLLHLNGRVFGTRQKAAGLVLKELLLLG